MNKEFIDWIGNFHPIFLHFPITLIVMTVISEFLFFWFGNPLFDHASRFMIVWAAITVIPTVLTGLAFGYDTHYGGIYETLFVWHRFFGIFTTILTIITAIVRELHTRRHKVSMKWYYVLLALLFIAVNITGFLGGAITFGPEKLMLPSL